MTTESKFEDGKLYVSRVYDAPREAVFEAWVETSKVQQWWGCAQTTAVRSEIEPKVGGKYNHTMTIEGAGEHAGDAELTVYDPPARLAFRSASPTGPDDSMLVTVDFTEVSGGTLVQLVHEGIPDMDVGGGMNMRDMVGGGWAAAFEKLGVFLGVLA